MDYAKRAFILIIFINSSKIFANTYNDLFFENKIRIANVELLLNGVGKRKILFFDAYYISLYLQVPSNEFSHLLSHNNVRVLEIRLLRDVSSSDFEKVIFNGFRNNTSDSQFKELKQQMDHLKIILKNIGDLKNKDIFNIQYSDESSHLVLNGKMYGSPIAGKFFNEVLLSIWLGNKPIDQKLKSLLLLKAH